MGFGQWFQSAARSVGKWFQPGGIKAYAPLLEQINALESGLEKLEGDQLAGKTGELRGRLDKGEPLDALLPFAFALVREASRRELGMRHFDVQMLGGIGLHKGCVVEMKTGEGKTLVATLPAYLNALTGKGVHVVTVNDYLASRDAEWMGKIYRSLGLEVGVVLEQMAKSEAESQRRRQEAYKADITYVTNHELVFDYLRDNLATSPEELVQRGQHFAIIDEVDLLLIDEVRTPLIISGPSEENVNVFGQVDRVVRRLNAGSHYKVELKSKTATLTEEGIDQVEKGLGVGGLTDPANLQWYHAVYQSVLAHGAYKRDVDYIVTKGEVQIIDEYTGRVSPDKRYAEGLHQALEAKERIKVRPEDRTYARMSYQNYFRQYDKICGMTGTARSEKEEFRGTYGVDVVVVPTNKPNRRLDYQEAVYVTQEDKLEAIVEEVKEMVREGRPVLIGTVSVHESERLARLLKKRKLPCRVLNAKNHEKEAEIIAQAGRKKAVTISTNMAGRGTDILLGGNPEKLAGQKAKEGSDKYKTWLERFEAECEEERQEVVEAGGLHVIGTSLHEADRLDAQLRGRAGRQGDPGSSQFIISLEDEIFHKYGAPEVEELIDRYADEAEGEEITDKGLLRLLEALRGKVAIEHKSERAETLKYDLTVNEQREHIYAWRSTLLQGSVEPEQHAKIVREMIEAVVVDLAELFLEDPEEAATEEDLDELQLAYENLFRTDVEMPQVQLPGDVTDVVVQATLEQIMALHEKREKQADRKALFLMQRAILLETIDSLWIEHLSNIERLEEGLQLVGYAQYDPLVVFRKEVGLAYKALLKTIRRRAVSSWFAISFKKVKPGRRAKSVWRGRRR